jgi:hypothetical protein
LVVPAEPRRVGVSVDAPGECEEIRHDSPLDPPSGVVTSADTHAATG